MRCQPGLRSGFLFTAAAFLLLFFSMPQPFFSMEKSVSQTERKTLLALLEEESPLSDLIYDLDDCYDRYLFIIETESRRLQAEKDKALLEFWERLQKELEDRNTDPAKKGDDTLADIGRMMQGIASEYNLDALFPGSKEERLRRCRDSLEMARLQVKTARQLEAAYAEILKSMGYPGLAGQDSPEDWELWAKEIEGFDCALVKERPPLRTEVVIPPRSKRPFVLKTFCLDSNRLGPGSGQALAVTGDIADLGRKNLAKLLRDVAAEPGLEIDIQRGIWDGEEEEEDTGGRIPVAVVKDQTGGSTSLAQGVSNGDISAEINTRENFSSVEIWIKNPGGQSRTVNVSGAVLDSGDSETQRLATAGVSQDDPPPGPKLKDPERKIEEILKRAEDWLRRAQERVRNGDHSREAIEDLIKAMHAAEAVGMDLEDSDWDLLREGLWEETDLTYKVYKANPTQENRETLIENMKAMDYIDPPEGKGEAFNSMMEDIFG
jgi:hypothetical protein